MRMNRSVRRRCAGMRMRGCASALLNKISLPVYHGRIHHSAKTRQEASSRIRMEASYMAETAVALPFFTAFLAALLLFFQALSVQQEVGGALLAAGRKMSVLECQKEGSSGGSLLLAKTLLFQNLKADSAAERFVRGGRMGISLAGSDFSGNYICLQADYCIPLPFGFFGRQQIDMTQRLKCRKWTGGQEDGDDEIVYITKNGSVYHKSRRCSYLSPSVSQTDGNGVTRLRNASGGKYYPCAKCMKRKSPNGRTVYITQYGNRYHGTKSCSEIMRTAIAARLSEVKGRKACSKCGQLRTAD